MTDAYTKAGVNLDAKNLSNRMVGEVLGKTFRPEVVGGAGFFGGMYEFKGYKNPVLVSSTDSVGTKTKIAIALDRYDTVGMDIVNHCVNDIFTSGAAPIFFLDYIGIGKLVPEKVASIVEGLAKACADVGCVLIGGETAELSDVYHGADYDLAGFVVGVVEKDKIIDGSKIVAGDVLIGLPSNGLHTNGYTLARKVFGDTAEALNKYYDELGRTAGEALLEPHLCYFNQLQPLLPYIKGMAHITGGGLVDNVPRIIPKDLTARFDSKAWEVPPIFPLLQKLGNVDHDEMYHVFNMGVGMAVACAPENTDKMTGALSGAKVIGEVVAQADDKRVIID
jgi:phosphoribosylformylglycinamidine cyclo-ligase